MNIESQVLNVPIEDIIPNRFQPRLNFDDEGLKELASSIKEHGIIQPLVLRRLNDKYEIIAGERRYKAAKMAGLTSVPAIINQMDDKNSAEVALVENIQRRDLSAIEEAKSFKTLLDKGYLTQDELAKKMGISQSAVSNKLRLLTLDESVQKALMEGKISERHARTLLKLTSLEEQAKWLKEIIDNRLTVQSLEKKIKETQTQEEKDDNNMIIPSFEEEKKEEKTTTSENINPFSDFFKPSPNPTIPNKFFNFLEDEPVTMSMEEKKSEEIMDDGIEMLDFEVPTNKSKDMTQATKLAGYFVSDLEINGYKAELNQTENEKEIIYTIKVKKED